MQARRHLTSCDCQSAPDQPCYEAGSMQSRLLPFAIFFFLLYSVGYPAFVAYVLLKPANRPKVVEDLLLAAQGLGNNRTENPRCYEFRKRYSRLYEHWRPEFWFWILIIMARKFLLSFSALMFRNNPTFQMCVILLVMFGAYALQVRCRPYMSEPEKAETLRRAREQPILGVDFSHVVGLVRSQSRRVPSLKLGETSIPARVQQAGRYFFNYNTVEAMLLGAAVLVSIFGIMFESAYLRRGSDDYETLTVLTLLVIVASIAYYVVVLWTEIVAFLVPALALPCLPAPATKSSNSSQKAAGQTQECNEIMNDEQFQMFERPVEH